MMENILKTINSFKSATHHSSSCQLLYGSYLQKALLDGLILVRCTCHLQGKQLSGTLNKTHPIMLWGIRLAIYSLGYFPISQSKHYIIMMASICTYRYYIRPSIMLGLGQWVEQCYLTMPGYQAKKKYLYCFSSSRTFAHHSMTCIC